MIELSIKMYKTSSTMILRFRVSAAVVILRKALVVYAASTCTINVDTWDNVELTKVETHVAQSYSKAIRFLPIKPFPFRILRLLHTPHTKTHCWQEIKPPAPFAKQLATQPARPRQARRILPVKHANRSSSPSKSASSHPQSANA